MVAGGRRRAAAAYYPLGAPLGLKCSRQPARLLALAPQAPARRQKKADWWSHSAQLWAMCVCVSPASVNSMGQHCQHNHTCCPCPSLWRLRQKRRTTLPLASPVAPTRWALSLPCLHGTRQAGERINKTGISFPALRRQQKFGALKIDGPNSPKLEHVFVATRLRGTNHSYAATAARYHHLQHRWVWPPCCCWSQFKPTYGAQTEVCVRLMAS